MPKENLIAKKYAEALAQTVSSEKILEELKLVSSSITEIEALKASLENPSINEEVKLNVIESAFKDELSAETLNLLKLCVKKRRVGVLASLAEHYETAFLEQNNIELAFIETASKVKKAEIDEIKTQLEKLFNKGIKIEAVDNPELIAGMKINVNNKVLDYSLNSKIKKLKQELES